MTNYCFSDTSTVYQQIIPETYEKGLHHKPENTRQTNSKEKLKLKTNSKEKLLRSELTILISFSEDFPLQIDSSIDDPLITLQYQ